MTTSNINQSKGRALALVLLGVAVVLLAVTALSGAGPAAAAGKAELTSSQGTLRWTVSGDVATKITLRTTRDTAACGSKASTECLDLRAEGVTTSPTPCEESSRPASGGFRARCGTAGIKRFALVGGRGPRTDISAGRRDGEVCSAVAITVTQVAGSGVTDVADGCRQVVQCIADSYVGPVMADSADSIDAACAYVTVEGEQTRKPEAIARPCTCPGGASSIGPTPNVPPAGPAPVVVAPSESQAMVAGHRPGLSSSVVRHLDLGKGARVARMDLAAGTQYTLRLQRQVGKAFRTIRTIHGGSAPGVARVALGSGYHRGTYRVAVRVPATRGTLVSRPISVR